MVPFLHDIVSIQFIDMFTAVCGIADECAAAEVDDEVEVFKRDLADEHWDVVGHFHNVHRT